MEIDYIALFVTDVERSVAFYRDALGFEFTSTQPDQAEGRVGRLRVGLYDRRWLVQLLGPSAATPIRGHSFLLSMGVPDLEAHYQHLQHLGVTILKPPQEMSWGQRLLFLADPDGNILELVESADPK
jgi:lactoylglutathione lyase